MGLIRRHVWWTVPALAAAVVAGSAIDRLFLGVVYGAVNAIGALMLVEGIGFSRRTDLILKTAAIVLLPVGLIGLVAVSTSAMPRDHTPLDSAVRTLPRNDIDSNPRFDGP